MYFCFFLFCIFVFCAGLVDDFIYIYKIYKYICIYGEDSFVNRLLISQIQIDSVSYIWGPKRRCWFLLFFILISLYGSTIQALNFNYEWSCMFPGSMSGNFISVQISVLSQFYYKSLTTLDFIGLVKVMNVY